MHISFQTTFKLVCALALPILFASASPTHSQALDQRATQTVNFYAYHYINGVRSRGYYPFSNIELEDISGSDTEFRIVGGWRIFNEDIPDDTWRFVPALAFKATGERTIDLLTDCHQAGTLLASGESSPDESGNTHSWVICRG